MENQLLWNNIRLGEIHAFEALYKQMYKELYRYGIRINNNSAIVDDCMQDLFFDLWLNHLKLPEVNSVKGYLIRSLKYKILQFKKESSQITRVELNESSLITNNNKETELIEIQSEEESKKILAKYLPLLTKRQQEAIRLRFYHQLNYDEIAEIMAISNQAAINLIYKSIKFLREKLQQSTVTILLILISLENDI